MWCLQYQALLVHLQENFVGAVDEVITVSDSKGLVDEFYSPSIDESETEDFYSAESFLRYGQALRVVRINTVGLKSANDSGSTASLVKNFDDYRKIIKMVHSTEQ